MKSKNWLFLILFFCSFILCKAQQKDWTWWNTMANWDGVTQWQNYLRYCPKYFGPNAFPVPEMSDGNVPSLFSVDVASECYFGFGDNAVDMNLRIDIPLYPKYVTLSLWMVPVEYYKTTIAVRNERNSRDLNPEGIAVGDLYVQTGIQLLRNKKYLPDIMINATMKTASGSPLTACRYFDTPGYYFDATIGKTFSFADEAKIKNIALSLRGGFLCWQAMQGFQDDAFLYGIKFALNTTNWHINAEWSGYAGWAQEGDKPMIVRGVILRKFKQNHHLYLKGVIGLFDYPFYCFSIGYQYKIPLILFK